MSVPARVEAFLEEQGIAYDLLTHPATGSTRESALAAHVPDDHLAKAVVIRDEDGPAVVVIPGDTWLDLEAVRRETGRDLRLDDESDLSRLFPDCAEGAVPAVAPAYGLDTLLDEALTTLASVYFEAGDHRHLVRVSGEDFVRMLSGVRHGLFGRRD
jgi:Ala-tRNA(Pro) deacylase